MRKTVQNHPTLQTNEKLDKTVRNNNLQTSDSSQHQAVIPEKRETHQVGPPIAQAACLEGIPPKIALTPQAPSAVALAMLYSKCLFISFSLDYEVLLKKVCLPISIFPKHTTEKDLSKHLLNEINSAKNGEWRNQHLQIENAPCSRHFCIVPLGSHSRLIGNMLTLTFGNRLVNWPEP